MNGLRTQQRAVVLAACLLGGLFIGWLDYVTGESSDAYILYFLPVLAAAWYSGIGAGVVVSVFSALDWLVSDLLVRAQFTWYVESWDFLMRLGTFLLLAAATHRIRTDLRQQQETNRKLADALAQIKQLTGILPMCSFCRRIRDEHQEWVPLESYISRHTEAQVSHGLCPRCYKKHFGEENGT